jgi:hypothetical protein
MFGSILEQTSECTNANKENSIITLKMAARNKSSTPLKGANEPNLSIICGDLGDRGNLGSRKGTQI